MEIIRKGSINLAFPYERDAILEGECEKCECQIRICAQEYMALRHKKDLITLRYTLVSDKMGDIRCPTPECHHMIGLKVVKRVRIVTR